MIICSTIHCAIGQFLQLWSMCLHHIIVCNFYTLCNSKHFICDIIVCNTNTLCNNVQIPCLSTLIHIFSKTFFYSNLDSCIKLCVKHVLTKKNVHQKNLQYTVHIMILPVLHFFFFLAIETLMPKLSKSFNFFETQ
jgi:hypothetical protein